MTDGTLATIDGRPALIFERVLPHSVDRVWQAVSTPAELAAWFPAAVAWTPLAGEALEAFGMTGAVLEVAAPHRLMWEFAGDRYSFDLDPVPDGCRLTFTHVFGDRSIAAQTAAGWACYLLRLDALLAGGALGEVEAHASWPQFHERFAAEFDVDPAAGRAFWAQFSAAQQ